uniref:DNA-protecting protein DprA n=1 Tax=Desulfacinum infernum TaxID=35837 RepID=A0A832EAQ9_9BACT
MMPFWEKLRDVLPLRGVGKAPKEEKAVRTELDESTRAWLTLKLTPELGNISVLKLVKRFGSAEAVCAARTEAAQMPGLRREARESLAAGRTTRPVEDEWRDLRHRGWGLICLGDPDYPNNLENIADPPAVLYATSAPEPRDLVAVAVVGSRSASPMGLIFTERLCADLARRGVTVVSGFALGIDSAAHRGAIRAGGRTLAVLGCGLDVLYPRPNADLRAAVMAHGGFFTEFPLGTPPLSGHFPQRNRIISGLALGVVVVEATAKSGSLITARSALEQGREVFAVPGTAGNLRSLGPHLLLRQGAALVESADDILEHLKPLIRPSRTTPSVVPPAAAAAAPEPEESPSEYNLSPVETALLGLLGQEPVHVDRLCAQSGLGAAAVTAALSALEIKGLVRQMPGKYFMRLL